MSEHQSAFADKASNLTRLLSPDPEFDDLVFRSLKPLSASLIVIFSAFVLLGLIDDDAGDARLLIVATDAAAVVFFLGLYFALSAGIVPRSFTYPLGMFIACIPIANSLLAFALTANPFFLSYLPMIAVVCGAYILSLPWLIATLMMILASTYLVAAVGEVLPIVSLLRYLPALIGSYLISILVFLTRRWHVIDSNRALLAIEAETEERKRAEAKLAHAQRLESIGKLGSGIAHDFNNLLMVIIGYTDSLLDATDKNSEVHHGLLEIQKSGEKAAALAQKLLAFSRQQVMQFRAVAINDLVSSTKSLVSRSMPVDVKVSLQLDADAGFVNVDPLQIEQVLINLALNARDAMAKSGGLLTISTASIGEVSDTQDDASTGRVQIRVSDTGCGMTDEVRDRAFEPFFTTKERGAGTGLGLSMVHGIVTQSGGTIDIDTTLNSGTTFTINLPRANVTHEEPAAVVPSRNAPRTLNEIKVLVVDDDHSVLDIVSRTLKRHKCDVAIAMSGDEALELVSREPFDFLLSDVVMPGMSGVELVQELRARGFSQPALLMSGHAAEKVAVAGGIETPILHKPFRAQELMQAISRLLEVEVETPFNGAPTADSVDDKGQQAGLRVLLVDDHAPILETVSQMLRTLGHSCITCSDPTQVTNILQEHYKQLDIVITDYSMPGMSGGDVIDVCRREYPRLITLLMTGYAEHEAIALARGKGAHGVLPKPMTIEELKSVLDNLVKSGQVGRAS